MFSGRLANTSERSIPSHSRLRLPILLGFSLLTSACSSELKIIAVTILLRFKPPSFAQLRVTTVHFVCTYSSQSHHDRRRSVSWSDAKSMNRTVSKIWQTSPAIHQTTCIARVASQNLVQQCSSSKIPHIALTKYVRRRIETPFSYGFTVCIVLFFTGSINTDGSVKIEEPIMASVLT